MWWHILMQGNLKKHINSEQVKNMFQCEECDETFESRGNCIDGYESGTGGTKQCFWWDVCGWEASIARDLMVHKDIDISRGYNLMVMWF